jgi:cation:H+ antiporter
MLIYILFVLGFIVLIKGADLLVDGSSSVAKKLDVSDLIIGLTVVAFGTSAPELFVNLLASIDGKTDLAIGNILGSNIANILLILGVASIIYPITVQKSTIFKEIPFSLLAALAMGVLANDRLIDGKSFSELSRSDGLILLGFFSIFLYYIVEVGRKTVSTKDDEVKQLSTLKSIIFILLGFVGLVLGGKWIVDGAIAMTADFGVSESFVGLTVVAIGTSLPELATSAVAAFKRNTDIAIGNVVGSNIFNIYWILGLSSVIKPLPFSPANNTDILMTIVASILLFFFIGRNHLLQRWQGIMFLLIYILYTIYLFMYR